jgi:hypothetical protein
MKATSQVNTTADVETLAFPETMLFHPGYFMTFVFLSKSGIVKHTIFDRLCLEHKGNITRKRIEGKLTQRKHKQTKKSDKKQNGNGFELSDWL